jgi:hypothetical protein
VVQIVIENQFHMLINGLASLPPILTLPKPDFQKQVKQITMQSVTASTAHKENSQPKLSRIQSLAPFTDVENAPSTFLSFSSTLSGAMKFRMIAASSNKNGGQKTKSGFIRRGVLASQ